MQQQLETAPHAPPIAVDDRSSTAGLRAVATFEALKGAGVVVLLLIVLLVHHNAEYMAESLLFHLHINPDRRASQAFLNAASSLNDARLITIAVAALAYVTVRFVEAWGLWNRRVWAEWFALLSGALYLPWEILKLLEHANWQHVAVLVINIIVVAYMLMIRIRSCMPGTSCAQEPVLSQK